MKGIEGLQGTLAAVADASVDDDEEEDDADGALTKHLIRYRLAAAASAADGGGSGGGGLMVAIYSPPVDVRWSTMNQAFLWHHKLCLRSQAVARLVFTLGLTTPRTTTLIILT